MLVSTAYRECGYVYDGECLDGEGMPIGMAYHYTNWEARYNVKYSASYCATAPGANGGVDTCQIPFTQGGGLQVWHWYGPYASAELANAFADTLDVGIGQSWDLPCYEDLIAAYGTWNSAWALPEPLLPPCCQPPSYSCPE